MHWDINYGDKWKQVIFFLTAAQFKHLRRLHWSDVSLVATGAVLVHFWKCTFSWKLKSPLHLSSFTIFGFFKKEREVKINSSEFLHDLHYNCDGHNHAGVTVKYNNEMLLWGEVLPLKKPAGMTWWFLTAACGLSSPNCCEQLDLVDGSEMPPSDSGRTTPVKLHPRFPDSANRDE